MIEIREFQQQDSEGICALFQTVYGDRYVYPDIYIPSLIGWHNAQGEWRSAIAEQNGLIIGHAALWRHHADKQTAEMAMFAVHPAFRNRGVATQLGAFLRLAANRLGLGTLTIKMVSSHQHSQRLAQRLGFYSTGLFRDYVPSPFQSGQRESVILGVLPLQPRPVPLTADDSREDSWIHLLKEKFGAAQIPATRENRAAPIEIAICDDRVDVTMNTSTPQTVDEISRLPARKLIYIRAPVDTALMSLRPKLWRAGFTDMGLEPAAGGGWFWLLQRGYLPGKLDLSCPIAIALQKTANANINHNACA
ncbi:GNAT family N-acetyltransferase [Klebsiella quasipneumoniae]|uniref:GNAT family N-acetyltransferase n=1 Tax=Klebsiella quasipneumoniae TaxID=1463165 RepID=UPI00191E7C09|nr:GNAT family N-acetyltransferase [Klebsiella quasipneumoniae]HCI6433163.1 GNAT family N-acetyltransferase [Klebsiella quasipneumoniae subsp. similipneumoniae]